MFQTLWRGLEGRVQADLRTLLWPVMQVLLECVLGLVGIGFLTASAYLAISAAYGPGWATLMLGAGFMGLAGVARLVSRLRPWDSVLPATEPTPGEATHAPPSEPTTTVAFTAAFVLGRYLAGKERS